MWWWLCCWSVKELTRNGEPEETRVSLCLSHQCLLPSCSVLYNSMALAHPRLICPGQCVRVTVLHSSTDTCGSCFMLASRAELRCPAGNECEVGCRWQEPLCLCAGHMVQAQVWDRLAMCCRGFQSSLCLVWVVLSLSRLTGGSITAEGMTSLVQAASQCLQLEEIKWVCCGNDHQNNHSFLGMLMRLNPCAACRAIGYGI